LSHTSTLFYYTQTHVKMQNTIILLF